MLKIKKILSFLMIPSFMFMSGCGNSSDAPTNIKELVYGLRSTRVVLDTTLTNTVEAMRIPENIYEGLLQVDVKTTTVVPCIAESLPEISDDNLNYTFHLKNNVLFHDGTNLTANDVKYSIERILNPKTASIMAEDFMLLKGAEDYINGSAEEVTGVEILDDYNIRFTLVKPFALFTDYLAVTPIYPAKACSEAGAEWGVSVMVGTGPFKLESIDLDSGCKLTKFEGYHDIIPNIDAINYKFFSDRGTIMLEYEQGNIDLMLIDDPFVESYMSNENFKNQIKKYRSYGNYSIIMNVDTAPWNDIKVREAFAYAINIPEITTNLLGKYTTPAKSFIPEGVAGYDSNFERIQYNPEKSKSILKSAGYSLPVKIDMTTYSFEHSGGKMTIALKDQIQNAGFEINPIQIEPNTFGALQNTGKISTYIYSSTGNYEADKLLYGMFYSKKSSSLSSNYSSDEYDKILEKARETLDKNERIKLYQAANRKLVNEDFIVVPICDRNQFYLSQSWLENFDIVNGFYPWKICDINLELKNN